MISAEATLVAEAGPAGVRCTTLRSSPPLTFREAAGSVHLVGTVAGPIGGDELRLRVRVERAAVLDVRSAAASLVLPGPLGAPSRWVADIGVAENARLTWGPEPMVLVRGCDHRVDVRLDLAAGAGLVWRDEIVFGRYREASGSLHQRVGLHVAGRPVHRSEVRVGPRWPASVSPATFGATARGYGTLLMVGLGLDREALISEPPDGAQVEVHELADGSLLASALGESASAVHDVLDSLTALARVGSAPPGAATPRPAPSTSGRPRQEGGSRGEDLAEGEPEVLAGLAARQPCV